MTLYLIAGFITLIIEILYGSLAFYLIKNKMGRIFIVFILMVLIPLMFNCAIWLSILIILFLL